MPRGRLVARRAGAGALIVAALAAGRVVQSAYGSDDAISEPYLVAGSLGRPVSLRYADVTATGVEGTTLVSAGFGAGTSLTTPGVWLVVPLKIVTKGKPAAVRYAAIEDRQGRRFLASGDRSQFSPGVSQPGVPRYASVLVEVPKDAIEGARLRVALDSLDQRRDDMADIDLGLTAAEADAWAARKDRVVVPEPADTPPATGSPTPTGPAGTGSEGTGSEGTT
jgi:pimeloyl-ACP methyl ester carboxylesterase